MAFPPNMLFDAVAGVSGGRAHVAAYGPRTPIAFGPLNGVSASTYVGDDGVHIYPAYNAAAGRSGGRMASNIVRVLAFQPAASVSNAGPPHFRGRYAMIFDAVAGVSTSYQGSVPDLSDNPPITLTLTLGATVVIYPPVGG